jgi:hypothetical protein
MTFFQSCKREAIEYDLFLAFFKNGYEVETAETGRDILFLCDRRRRVAIAFWISLFRVAFAF